VAQKDPPGREDPNSLTFRVEGGGIHPHNADPRVLLRLAAAYFDSVAAVVATSGRTLALTGCWIVDECAAVRSTVANDLRDVALLAARDVSAFARGEREPPKGTKGPIGELRDALGMLTADATCDFFVGKDRVEVLAPHDPTSPTMTSRSTLRCTIMYVGGEKPGVTLNSPSEQRAFRARCRSRAQAEQLGTLLYRQIDAELVLEHDVKSGSVVSAELDEFSQVPSRIDDDPINTWRRWFASAGKKWEDVEDVDAELARIRYGDDR
jgi:hypothetical protein